MDVGSALQTIASGRAHFERLGRVELPAARAQVTAVWLAADARGMAHLASQARAQFEEITARQAEWETLNETLERVDGWLAAIGLGAAIPLAAWQIAVIVAAVVAFVALLRSGDELRDSAASLVASAVASGAMSPADAARLLADVAAETKSGWPTAVIIAAIAAAAIVLVPRIPSRAG